MKDKKSFFRRSTSRSNTHVVLRLTPNGCLTFVIRIVGLLLAIGYVVFLILSEKGII